MRSDLTALCGECRFCRALRDILDSGNSRWLGDICLAANGRGDKTDEFGRAEAQCIDLLRDALRMPFISTGLVLKATAEQSPPKTMIPWWLDPSVFGSDRPEEALVEVSRDAGGNNAEV